MVGGKWKKNLDFWKSSILEEAYWPTNAPCPISGMEEEKFSLKKLLDRDDNTQKNNTGIRDVQAFIKLSCFKGLREVFLKTLRRGKMSGFKVWGG